MSYYFFHKNIVFLVLLSGEAMTKLKKKYLFLFIIIIIGIIMGVIFSNILSIDDEKLVYTKLTTYFNNLKNDIPINYMENLLSSIKTNIIYLILIWIFGLSIIGLFFNNFIIFFKSFILGFSIGSIVNIYFYSGLILSFVYIFPCMLINLLVYLIMTYYANDFSLKLFDVLFRKKEYKFNIVIKKYAKLLCFLLVILIVSSLFETFITPFFIKLCSFLIK